MEILTMLMQSEGSMLEKIVAGVVIYFVARREVRKQFTMLNDQLGNIEGALRAFGKDIVDLETKHDVRITKLEGKIETIEKVVLTPREALNAQSI